MDQAVAEQARGDPRLARCGCEHRATQGLSSRSLPVKLAYVSGGSNLAAADNLVIAARALTGRHPGARYSRCYRNRAVGFDGPDFINFVGELPVAGDPLLLKGELECIETQCGRTRDAPKWAPRAMDLDILLFDEVVQDTPGLVLPRPDLLRWGFML